MAQPIVSGKFLEIRRERFLIKGVRYGGGGLAPDRSAFLPEALSTDLKAIVRLGANTIRTCSPPPIEFLDEADRHGLRVIVGLPWPQHVAFPAGRRSMMRVRADIRRQVDRLASHPATLLFAIGSPILPGIIQRHGSRTVARMLRDLCDEARSASPRSLFTHFNYLPSKDLDTSAFDVCAFNIPVRESDLTEYVTRLHETAGPRPLLISAMRPPATEADDDQRPTRLSRQLRGVFSRGACGAIVPWSDEWQRGCEQSNGSAAAAFERSSPRSYHEVRHVFHSAPFGEDSTESWPRTSVIVCARNAESTIGACLASLRKLRYPAVQLIVVDRGSTDATPAIAASYGDVRVVHITDGGLAVARNIGVEHATGDIVAFADANASVDPDWLSYLVQPLFDEAVVASSGRNVAPANVPWLAHAVAQAAGALTDKRHERRGIPVSNGNCAFRREALSQCGGFHSTSTGAGGEGALCWRLQAAGWKVERADAAIVWHHHRGTIERYWSAWSDLLDGFRRMMRLS